MLTRRPWEYVTRGSPGGVTCPESLHVSALWSAFSSESVPGPRAVVIALEGWAVGQWLQGKSRCPAFPHAACGRVDGSSVGGSAVLEKDTLTVPLGLHGAELVLVFAAGHRPSRCPQAPSLASPTSALHRTGGRSETPAVSPHPRSHPPFSPLAPNSISFSPNSSP